MPAMAERETGLAFAECGGSSETDFHVSTDDVAGVWAVLRPMVVAGFYPLMADDSMLSLMEEHAMVLRRCGATEFALHYEIRYSDQCNMEFAPGLLDRVIALGATLHLNVKRETTAGVSS